MKSDFSVFKQYISDARLNRYLIASGNSKSKSYKLYISNLKIAQAFHPLLGTFEVILRNRLNDILSYHFNDTEWVLNQKNGFMSDPSLKFKYKRTGKIKLNDYLKSEILKAEKRILKSGSKVTSGKIIAEQPLGFWTDLFEVHHYRLLKGKPIQIFQSLPPGLGRKDINEELNKIRRFRNRINHNEPICFKENNIDFTDTLNIYQSIIKLLAWIDPKIFKLISELDNVMPTIALAVKS